MRTKNYNCIKRDDLLHSVRLIVGEEVLKHAVITVVYTKNGAAEWRYLVGKCEFSDGCDDIEEIYSDAAFVRRCIRNFDLENFLISLDGDGYKISDGLPSLTKSDGNNTSWTEEIVPSNVTITKHPERKYSAKIVSQTTFNDGILLGYESGFRPSSREYVKEFMGLTIYHGQSHGDNGEFSISIPDHRGKIVLDESRVLIDSHLCDICLVGDIPNIGRIRLTKEETLEASESSLNESELWLLTNDNKILDFRSVSEWQYRVSETDDNKSESKQILALIERGEGHETEFKPYIDLTDRTNSKAKEVERTVCALSNAKGGYLLIGVDDDACIKGVDDKAKGHYKTGIDEALEAYKNDIQKRLQEKLRYNQCFDISHVRIGENHVIVVLVERTEKPNYFVNNDLAYIRKGATSVKMKSSDERENDKLVNTLFN
ncbi:MAG: ATP-binding protein [Candidatus Thiodiazotropha endolucinida]|nr:ATP-binding protein [Candidatus Thiodiazotropha endolucinida]